MDWLDVCPFLMLLLTFTARSPRQVATPDACFIFIAAKILTWTHFDRSSGRTTQIRCPCIATEMLQVDMGWTDAPEMCMVGCIPGYTRDARVVREKHNQYNLHVCNPYTVKTIDCTDYYLSAYV